MNRIDKNSINAARLPLEKILPFPASLLCWFLVFMFQNFRLRKYGVRNDLKSVHSLFPVLNLVVR